MDRRAVDDVAGAVALPGVPGADVADGWDGLSGHPKAVAHVVHGNVVCHQPKERRQCSGAATCSWPRQLRDGVDLAAQVAPGNGPPRKGPAILILTFVGWRRVFSSGGHQGKATVRAG